MSKFKETNADLSSTVYIYTDASFDKNNNLAVAGFLVFDKDKAHEGDANSSSTPQLFEFTETNNIRAEIRGALLAMDFCSKTYDATTNVFLYSDCQTIHKLPGRRKALVTNNFISKSKNQRLANADLYLDFFKLFDKLQPKLFWIKGHSPQNQKQTPAEKHFSTLDKSVRKRLREIVAQTERATPSKV